MVTCMQTTVFLFVVRFKDIFGSCDALSKEIDALKSELPSDSQLVFCHNDLLCGNLIYNEKNGLQVIFRIPPLAPLC